MGAGDDDGRRGKTTTAVVPGTRHTGLTHRTPVVVPMEAFLRRG